MFNVGVHLDPVLVVGTDSIGVDFDDGIVVADVEAVCDVMVLTRGAVVDMDVTVAAGLVFVWLDVADTVSEGEVDVCVAVLDLSASVGWMKLGVGPSVADLVDVTLLECDVAAVDSNTFNGPADDCFNRNIVDGVADFDSASKGGVVAADRVMESHDGDPVIPTGINDDTGMTDIIADVACGLTFSAVGVDDESDVDIVDVAKFDCDLLKAVLTGRSDTFAVVVIADVDSNVGLVPVDSESSTDSIDSVANVDIDSDNAALVADFDIHCDVYLGETDADDTADNGDVDIDAAVVVDVEIDSYVPDSIVDGDVGSDKSAVIVDIDIDSNNVDIVVDVFDDSDVAVTVTAVDIGSTIVDIVVDVDDNSVVPVDVADVNVGADRTIFTADVAVDGDVIVVGTDSDTDSNLTAVVAATAVDCNDLTVESDLIGITVVVDVVSDDADIVVGSANVESGVGDLVAVTESHLIVVAADVDIDSDVDIVAADLNVDSVVAIFVPNVRRDPDIDTSVDDGADVDVDTNVDESTNVDVDLNVDEGADVDTNVEEDADVDESADVDLNVDDEPDVEVGGDFDPVESVNVDVVVNVNVVVSIIDSRREISMFHVALNRILVVGNSAYLARS